jgi:hypothetical protein
MVFAPTVREMALLAAPLATGANAPPLTCTSRLAPAWDAVGVTVSVEAEYGTVAE